MTQWVMNIIMNHWKLFITTRKEWIFANLFMKASHFWKYLPKEFLMKTVLKQNKSMYQTLKNILITMRKNWFSQMMLADFERVNELLPRFWCAVINPIDKYKFNNNSTKKWTGFEKHTKGRWNLEWNTKIFDIYSCSLWLC